MKSQKQIKMTDLKDTIQVGLANGSAIGFSLTDCNEILTFVSLVLAIGFTIYKFIKYEKNNL
tara:strand:- start:475 stop:660 length:186 start_codon:yes stop_codon:yes gene_type:complete